MAAKLKQDAAWKDVIEQVGTEDEREEDGKFFVAKNGNNFAIAYYPGRIAPLSAMQKSVEMIKINLRTNGVQNHHGGIKSIGTLVKVLAPVETVLQNINRSEDADTDVDTDDDESCFDDGVMDEETAAKAMLAVDDDAQCVTTPNDVYDDLEDAMDSQEVRMRMS
eukprot:scaffold74877_cov38-Cyclotella_meneghiniana.AAC.1